MVQTRRATACATLPGSTSPAACSMIVVDGQGARLARRASARAMASDPLLTAQEAAPETGRALSTFWRDVKRGTLPPPYYVTPRCPRWRLSELRAVVAAAPRKPAL